MNINISELVEFYDDGDRTISKHVSALTGLIGEDFKKGEWLNCLIKIDPWHIHYFWRGVFMLEKYRLGNHDEAGSDYDGAVLFQSGLPYLSDLD